DELQTAYGQAERNEPIVLPTPSTSWRSWVRQVYEYARSPDRIVELAWWQTALTAPSLRAGPLFPPQTPDVAPQQSLRTTLSPAQTETLILDAPRAYRMRVDEVLLAVLASVTGVLTGRDEILVELEGHGREDVIDGVDLSRTAGWFTTQYPLALPSSAEPHDALQRVHARLTNVPARGLHWGLLAHCADAASRAALAALPVPEISFNYLGRFDQTFQQASRFGFAREAAGDPMAAATLAPDRALDVNAWISGDALSIDWGYAPQQIPAALAGRLVAAFETALATTLEHLRDAAPAQDAAAKLPAVPAAVAELAIHDSVAASWAERARFEAALAVPAPAQLAHWLGHRDTAAHAALLPAVPLNALGAPVTLFCPHPGYGMVGEYRTLARALNGAVTVVALQAPALRGAPWDGASFEALAERYADCIATWQPHGPYALLGWSFGGRLAFALADCFARRGQAVSFLGIVDTATHWESEAEAIERATADAAQATDIPRLADPQDAERFLIARTLDAEPSLLRAAFAADAVHARVMAAHALPRVAVDLHVWRAGRTASLDPRRRMDWMRYASGEVVSHSLDATHSSIVHHPALGEQVARLLA
uniref:thioesterase domain-containing protein n=1 Tax=Paraburkholderia phosphatilytica TaxID=2282883 RepID=UPI001F0BB745